jgi:membrane protease YdiL (CAAX protease family)
MMRTVTSLVKRYPLATFFGIAYATSFIGGYLSERFPSDLWAVFVYGPLIGGFIVTAIDEGRGGLKVWLSRIVRWRVGILWYFVALLLPVLLRAVAYGVNLLLGATSPTAAQVGAWPDVLPQALFILLFIGLAEEPGFRGFALERMLKSRPALSASLLVGVLATIWHLPLFLNGSEPLIIIPIILAGAVLLGWVYVHTNGSVLLTMLMHTSVNTTGLYFDSLFAGADLARQTVLLSGVYVLAALILVAVTGTSLARRPAVQPATGSKQYDA